MILTFEQLDTSTPPRTRILSAGPGRGQTTFFFNNFKLMSILYDSSGNKIAGARWQFEISDGDSYNDDVDSAGAIGVVCLDADESARHSQFQCHASFVLPKSYFSHLAKALISGQNIRQIRLDISNIVVHDSNHCIWPTGEDLMIRTAIIELGE